METLKGATTGRLGRFRAFEEEGLLVEGAEIRSD